MATRLVAESTDEAQRADVFAFVPSILSDW